MPIKNQKPTFLVMMFIMSLSLASCGGGSSNTNDPSGNNNPDFSMGTPISRSIIIDGINDGINEDSHTFKATVTGQYSLLLTTANSTSCNYEVTKTNNNTKHIDASPRRCNNHERLTDLPLIAGVDYLFKFKATDATSFRANFLINSEGTPNNALMLSTGEYSTVVGTLSTGNRNSSFYRVNLPMNATLTIDRFTCGAGHTLWLKLFDYDLFAGINSNPVARSQVADACIQSLPLEDNRDYLVHVSNNSPSKTFFEPGVQSVNFKINITP